MTSLTFYPGDIALIAGVRVHVDRTVTLRSEAEIERIPLPGLADLPETRLRIGDLWIRNGKRAPMTSRHDLRCPCGSAYIRRSTTHHSCQQCQRVWANEEVPE
jgi:hypothetical protein